ncbi:uncharacterized protein MONBRDRAFT_30179 [Monosiga brevicollis MX1]|uniref:Sulfotransferase domain-containing protein n=1 Tax=Monosiga brevicollis TaxID=81824 RepID=A9VD83_MONBE|nr:uncharacterized protein MONBRDRAFT_30179 [Monosiga brevicollis MX1]EDQ84511.1 predicted protein [Monosiga brevicollis MX1]|eukprot:XP_001750698.1 hypothetical protein [Monosiga brevicollis MX1]
MIKAPILAMAFGLLGAVALPLDTSSDALKQDCTMRGGTWVPMADHSVCVCDVHHRCLMKHSDVISPPCAHGVVRIEDTLRDRLPAHCQNCVCIQGEPSIPRIVMASIPRSGNSWSRDMIELVTKRATETVFPETFRAFEDGPNSERETYSATWSEASDLYRHECGHVHDCSHIKPGSDFIVAKTHSPFILTHGGAAGTHGTNLSDAGVGVFNILPVRNPLDNWDAWHRWLVGKGRNEQLAEWPLDRFVEHWLGFHRLWQDTLPYSAQPRYIFRFEDLASDDKRVRLFHGLVNVLPYGNRKAGDEMAKSMAAVEAALSDPRVAPREKNNRAADDVLWTGHLRYSRENITYVIDSCREYLDRFGYLDLYQGWLNMLDMQAEQEKLYVDFQRFPDAHYSQKPTN